MLSLRKLGKLLMEKDIFWINLICLQFCGIWSPNCATKSFKSRLFEAYKYLFFIFSLVHTVYAWSLIYLFIESISFMQISFNVLYGIQYLAAVCKATYLIKNIHTLRWLVLVEKTELRYENNRNFCVGLMKIKKIVNSATTFFWIASACIFITASMSSQVISSRRARESKIVCANIYEKLYPIYKQRNLKIPDFKQNDVYENVYLMQTHLNLSASADCVKPAKEIPWLTKTSYNHHVSPYYELTLLLEMIILLYRSLYVVPIDMLIMSMLLYVKFQFELINMDLVNLYDNSLQTVEDMISKDKTIQIFKEKYVSEEYIRRIKNIVKHHQLVLRFSEKVELCFSDMIFGQYLGSTSMLGLMLIQVSNPDLNLVSILSVVITCTVLIFQIFVNCLCGNRIKIESGNVSAAAYFSNWQNLGRDSNKAKKYILLLMSRSQTPTVIAIGKFGYLDLDAFVSLAKASYSYFNVMAKTQGK